jgi:hypothetical protein
MALPISYSVPQLMDLSRLDSAIPEGTQSKVVRVQPSNLSTIVSPTYTCPARNTIMPDTAFASQNVIFDCPTSQGSWIDTRQSTISFRVNYEVVNAGVTYRVGSVPSLRGGAFSFWDGIQILSPQGSVIESTSELALVYNYLTQYAMSNSDRDGAALQMGFYQDGPADGLVTNGLVRGQDLAFLGTNAADLAALNNITHSYSYPLLSSVIGTGASRFFPIGAVGKLQCVMTTTNTLPITITTFDQVIGTAATFRVTISDMILNLVYVTLPPAAQQMIESSLVDGKYYLQGNQWRVSASTISAGVTGFNSILAGVRGSSVKSIAFSFHELLAARSPYGKFDSKNPIASQICFNANSVRFPALPLEALLHPARVMTDNQRAVGSFNSKELKSAVLPTRFCRLSTGGAAQSLTANPNTQDYLYTVQAAIVGAGEPNGQSSFFFAQDLEDVNAEGILSGTNLNSASSFLEITIAAPVTNAHTVYCMACCDSIVIVDARSGSMDVRV